MDWFGASLTPLDGGFSGETFLVGDVPSDQVVLRIYRSNPDRAVVDASLLGLVRGILPVPEVIEARPARGDEPALLVTEKLDGVPLDVLLRADPPDIDLEEIGFDLGFILARLSGIPFLRPGMFAGPELSVSHVDMPTDLGEFAQHYRDTGRLAAWQDRDFDALLDLIDLAEEISAEAAQENHGRTVLVHSDFNAKNILVDPESGEVSALLDWEFAHAGSPYADYGNLTRFERDDRIAGAAIEAFVNQAPGVRNADERGRAADLWALVELAGRVPSNAVCELATELLLAQARTADLHAWPWDTPRVDPNEAKPVL
ncbi:MAG: phosphotransferase [Nocardioidaceae bacterium]